MQSPRGMLLHEAGKLNTSPGTPATPTTQHYAYSPMSEPVHARRIVSSPVEKPMYFSPIAPKTISVLHRPKDPVPSMKNAENIDVQHAKDMAAADRHAAAYRRLALEKWHHNGPVAPTLMEQGHIVDRGRGKAAQQLAQGVFDPILSEFKVPPTDPKVAENIVMPSSAPRVPSSALRQDKALQEARGVVDPITGATKASPNPAYSSRKQLEFERNHGGRGITSKIDKHWRYDPIVHDYKPVSPGANKPGPITTSSRPQTAPPSSLNVTRPDRPHVTSKRTIRAGETWGQYDPLHNTWRVPPADAKLASDASATLFKTHGLTGSHNRKVPLPPSQGVYNPILNEWTVFPKNTKIIQGLSFAPATMFSKPTPSTVRSPK